MQHRMLKTIATALAALALAAPSGLADDNTGQPLPPHTSSADNNTGAALPPHVPTTPDANLDNNTGVALPTHTPSADANQRSARSKKLRRHARRR